jgi:D-3-phosphoglycerate dehydrogenase
VFGCSSQRVGSGCWSTEVTEHAAARLKWSPEQVSKPVVLIAEELSPATVDALGPDFEIRHCDGSNRAELIPAIADVDAILLRSATKVDAEALAAAKKLKVVARAGVGLDNVDVKAATQAGVMVVNAPTSNITSAAELAVALLLASARNVVPANEALRAGEWKRSKYSGVELSDKVVGIVGLGRIGILVAQRLSAFGVQLLAYDPYVQPARAAQLGVKMTSLDELLAVSDFITVHLPKTPETLGLIGDEALHKVKPDVRIINAARGGIVDEQALYDALVDGRVAGAGLDVYSSEPCTDLPLFQLDTVVATPHLGASTGEAQEKAGVSVAKSVRLALAGELVPDAVNVQGGVLAETVKPLLPLAEQLGTIACGLSASAIERVDIDVLGEVAAEDVRVLELSALKGIFGVLQDDPVSYVNAPLLAKDRGIDVSLTTDSGDDDHRSVVRVRTTLTDGSVVSVAGTVAGPRSEHRLVQVDGFDLEVPISSHMVFLGYGDKPGVVGVIGQLLGDDQINIAGMQVGRTDEGGQALTVLTVDSAISAATMEKIVDVIGAGLGVAVDLD